MEKLPQRLVNVRADSRDALTAAIDAPSLTEAVAQASDELEGRGRVLVRTSGTEPLIRVMVEAPTDAEADETCERLCDAVRAALGAR